MPRYEGYRRNSSTVTRKPPCHLMGHGNCRRLHDGAAETRIQDQRLDVDVEPDRAVHLGLDVLVQRIAPGSCTGGNPQDRPGALCHPDAAGAG